MQRSQRTRSAKASARLVAWLVCCVALASALTPLAHAADPYPCGMPNGFQVCTAERDPSDPTGHTYRQITSVKPGAQLVYFFYNMPVEMKATFDKRLTAFTLGQGATSAQPGGCVGGFAGVLECRNVSSAWLWVNVGTGKPGAIQLRVVTPNGLQVSNLAYSVNVRYLPIARR